jgi:hypothetical protein
MPAPTIMTMTTNADHDGGDDDADDVCVVLMCLCAGQPKTISPGNHLLKINSIELEDFKFIDNAKHLMLHVETEPIEGFTGFMIDKDNDSKGHYAGQIGRVKASQYAYADGETKSGIKIQRDRSILMFLQGLSKAFEFYDWFINEDGKHATIEKFVDALNKAKPFEDKYIDFCIAGKEYEGKTGYINFDMWLPKAEGKKYAFGAEKDGVVIVYNEAKHLKKLEVKEVKSFGDDDVFLKPKTSSDFSLD